MSYARFFIFCIAMCFFSHSKGQFTQSQMSYLDSARTFRTSDSLSSYINSVIEFVNSRDRKQFSKQILLDTLSAYKPFRMPLTQEESQVYRRYISTLQYWYKSVNGSLNINVEELKMASGLAWDSIFLDKQAFYIEGGLGSYYARMDNYTEAIFWYEKGLKGFKQRAEYALLCRTYKMIFESSLSSGDTLKARSAKDSAVYYLAFTDDYKAQIAVSSMLSSWYKISKDYTNWYQSLNEEQALILSNSRDNLQLYRLSDLETEFSEFYREKKDFAKAIYHIEASIKFLEKYFKDSKIQREIAKAKILKSQYLIGMNEFNKAKTVINSAYSHLFQEENIESFDDINSAHLYPENTLVDLLILDASLDKKMFLQNEDAKYPSVAFSKLELAKQTNEIINEKQLFTSSKKLSTIRTRDIINLQIQLFAEMNQKKQLSEEAWLVIRNLFSESKDIILNDRLVFNQKIQSLPFEERSKIVQLQEDYSKTFDHIFRKDLINQDSLENRIVEIKQQIRALIDDKEELKEVAINQADYIEYAYTSDLLYAIYEINGEKNFVQLGERKQINQLIFSIRDNILAFAHEPLDRNSLKNLYQILIPTTNELPTRLRIIPDGLLSEFPFEILINPNDAYVIDRSNIYYTSQFQYPAYNSKSKKEFEICLLSPDYQGAVQNEWIAMAEVNRSSIYPLYFAKEEINSIYKKFRNAQILSSNLSQDQVSASLKKAKIFHFAGHAKAIQDSNYLVLQLDEAIQKWYQDQVYMQHFDLEMVCLSACETGLGEMTNGDGNNSIARAFQAAGAQAVIQSLWTTNDKSGASIMNLFYKNLKNGMSKDIALRKAKLTFLEDALPEQRHPYYWSGIVPTGNMKALYKSKMQTFSYLIFIAFLGVISIFFIYQFKNKTK